MNRILNTMAPVNSITQAYLVEPESKQKRRRLAAHIHSPGAIEKPDLEFIKEKLRNIRNYSIDHLDDLCTEFQTTLEIRPDVDVVFAHDDQEAAKAIIKLSEDSCIAINKSSVVREEIKPLLVRSGLHVIDTYYDQFEPFENKLGTRPRFPGIGVEALYDSFGLSEELMRERRKTRQERGSKSFIGVLGVNVVSADDGAVFLLQHMHNIKDVFEQSKKLILVVGIDKIVRNSEDALFMTRCMGAFGSGVVAGNIQGKEERDTTIDNLPFKIPENTEEKMIHVILLDNGRSKMLRSQYRDLMLCIGCRACIKRCPASPFFKSDKSLSPKEYIHSFVSDRSHSLDQCLQCKSCKSECPLEIDIPGMILKERTKVLATKHTSPADLFITNYSVLAKWGSYMSVLANAIAENKIARLIGERILGINGKRSLPEIKGATFSKWYNRRSKKK
jgi:L-lactate utilization protein LutB